MVGDGALVAPVLRPERGSALLGRSERIKRGVRPVLEQRFEDALDQRGLEVLQIVEPGLAILLVKSAGEKIDAPIMVHGANDRIEVHDAVEKRPRDITLDRAKKSVSRHDMAAVGPFDMSKILVAAEAELPQRKASITVLVRLN